jgi:hypothetical protein
MPESSGWQPIETAPRNGTDVLLWGYLPGSRKRLRPPYVGAAHPTWGPGWYSFDEPDTQKIIPVYWMPIEEPPPI